MCIPQRGKGAQNQICEIPSLDSTVDMYFLYRDHLIVGPSTSARWYERAPVCLSNKKKLTRADVDHLLVC